MCSGFRSVMSSRILPVLSISRMRISVVCETRYPSNFLSPGCVGDGGW